MQPLKTAAKQISYPTIPEAEWDTDGPQYWPFLSDEPYATSDDSSGVEAPRGVALSSGSSGGVAFVPEWWADGAKVAGKIG